MGAALATRCVGTPPPLLIEYLAHSLRSLEECAAIYLGVQDIDDDDGGQSVGTKSCSRRTQTTYPRYLTLEQFEEVFGVLVGDAEPHYAFFNHTGGVGSSVCAHHIFCSLAVVARADLHSKVRFLLRLYATNEHGELPVDRRRLLLRDVLGALPHILRLAEPVGSHVVSYLEKELFARDEQNLSTCREFYDICFTSARVSGLLHEIQAVVHEMGTIRENNQGGRTAHVASKTEHASTQIGSNDNSGRLRLLNRGATMLQLTHEALLWSKKAGDLSWFWRQAHLALSEETLVSDALHAMKTNDTSAVLVVGPDTTYVGLLTTDDFLTYLVSLLPEDVSSTQKMNDLMRLQVVKSGQNFAGSSLRDMLAGTHQPPADRSRTVKAPSRHQCVFDDECFFNLILRIACGAHTVAVFRGQPAPSAQPELKVPGEASLLGCVSVFDVLEWLLQDVSILSGPNGKERYSISAFPWLCHTPTFLDASGKCDNTRPCFVDAFVRMGAQKLSGMLFLSQTESLPSLKHARILTADCVRDLFRSTPIAADERLDHERPTFDMLTPLHVINDLSPGTLQPCCVVRAEDSVVSVVSAMVTHRSRRVYIQDASSEAISGVVRITDILRLLLQEQHCKPRFV